MFLRVLARLQAPLIALLVLLVRRSKAQFRAVDLGCEHKPKPATPDDELEEAISHVYGKRVEWCTLTCKERAGLLRACMQSFIRNAKATAAATAAVKGSYESGHGEEMQSLVAAFFALEAFYSAMRSGCAVRPNKLREVDGQWIADVWPVGVDNVLFGGGHAEVWIKPGCKPTQGKLYKEKARGDGATPEGIVGLLAAGNHLSVSVRDLLHQLLVNDMPAVIKMNPCNDYTGPLLQRLLEPLHSRGFFRVVYGGAEVAQALVRDPRVAALHMTGSRATYNAIVWGAPEPGAGEPLVTKPFEAELGCVTPAVIVPSGKRWSAAELRYHAENVVASKVLNAGHNCLATQVIVTARNWPQRLEFLAAVRSVLDGLSQRVAWYPGSEAKMDAFRRRFPQARELGTGVCSRERCTAPYLLVEGLAPGDAQLEDEVWCTALQEVALDTPSDEGGAVDVAAFLDDAVAFCNDRCSGTLGMSLSVHPSVPDALVRGAVARLRYGNICVNASTNIGYGCPAVPWGGWAAAGTPRDIGSGNVLSHATMFEHAEKGVVWMPFVVQPKPIWLPTHPNLEGAALRAMQFMANRNPLTFIKLLCASLA